MLKSLEKLLSLSYNNNAIISQFNTYYLCKQSFVFVKNVLCVVLFRCADNDVRCEMIAKSQDNGTFLYAVLCSGIAYFFMSKRKEVIVMEEQETVTEELYRTSFYYHMEKLLREHPLDTGAEINKRALSMLQEIKEIVMNEDIEDFDLAENIVNVFTKYDVDFGARHDFG